MPKQENKSTGHTPDTVISQQATQYHKQLTQLTNHLQDRKQQIRAQVHKLNHEKEKEEDTSS